MDIDKNKILVTLVWLAWQVNDKNVMNSFEI